MLPELTAKVFGITSRPFSFHPDHCFFIRSPLYVTCYLLENTLTNQGLDLPVLFCPEQVQHDVGSEQVTHAGFGRFQWMMLFYTGMAWCADAMEMMLLSFLGPAVSRVLSCADRGLLKNHLLVFPAFADMLTTCFEPGPDYVHDLNFEPVAAAKVWWWTVHPVQYSLITIVDAIRLVCVIAKCRTPLTSTKEQTCLTFKLLLAVHLQARCEWGLQPSQESLITSVVFVGTLSGAYAWGSLGDSKGRKLGFFATALFTVSFGLLSAVAPSFGVSTHTRFSVPCKCDLSMCNGSGHGLGPVSACACVTVRWWCLFMMFNTAFVM